MNATPNKTHESVDETDCSESTGIAGIMAAAISLARKYSIDLIPGTPNTNPGDCAIETVLDQINQRDCYPNKLLLSVEQYRATWLAIAESAWSAARNSAFYSVEKCFEGWSRLKDDGQYENKCFADFFVMAIMHCIKKNALVFNICDANEHSPVSAIRADCFGSEADSEVPLVLVYNGSSYESFIPASEQDIKKTTYIVKQLNSFEDSDHSEQLIKVGWSSDCCPTDSRRQNAINSPAGIEHMQLHSTGTKAINQLNRMPAIVESLCPTSSIKKEGKTVGVSTDTEDEGCISDPFKFQGCISGPFKFCNCVSDSDIFKCKKKFQMTVPSDSLDFDYDGLTIGITTLRSEWEANKKRHRDLKRRKRAGETKEEKEERQKRDREQKREKRAMENVEEMQARRARNKFERRNRLATESVEKGETRRKQMRDYQRLRIASETEEEGNARRKRNRDSKREKYQSRYATGVTVQ